MYCLINFHRYVHLSNYHLSQDTEYFGHSQKICMDRALLVCDSHYDSWWNRCCKLHTQHSIPLLAFSKNLGFVWLFNTTSYRAMASLQGNFWLVEPDYFKLIFWLPFLFQVTILRGSFLVFKVFLSLKEIHEEMVLFAFERLLREILQSIN